MDLKSGVELSHSLFPLWKNSSPSHLILDHTGSLWLTSTVHCIALISGNPCDTNRPVSFSVSIQSCGSQVMTSLCRNLGALFHNVRKKYTDFFISSCETSRCFSIVPVSVPPLYTYTRCLHRNTPSVGCALTKAELAQSGESTDCVIRVWRAEQTPGVNLQNSKCLIFPLTN